MSLFSVGHLLLVIGLPLSVVFLSRETPLEKAIFSFVSSCQLEIASGYVVGLVFTSLGDGTASDLYLCRPLVLCQSLFVFIHASVLLCLEGLISLVSSIPTGSYNLFASLLQSSLSPEGRDMIEAV